MREVLDTLRSLRQKQENAADERQAAVASDREKQRARRAEGYAANAADAPTFQDDEERDPTFDPSAEPSSSSDDDEDDDVGGGGGGGGGLLRVTSAALVEKACSLIKPLKAKPELATLVAGDGSVVKTDTLIDWDTTGLAPVSMYALGSRVTAPTSQEWPIRVKDDGDRGLALTSGPAFGLKKFPCGYCRTGARAVVKGLAFARQFALAAYVGMYFLLCDPDARDAAAVADIFVKAFAQMQIPAHQAAGFDAVAKLALAVARRLASLADVTAAEVAALEKAIADAYPDALLAAENALYRRWMKGVSLTLGEIAANALETGARGAILACTLVPKPHKRWGPLAVLFAFYRYLCARFPCAPQVYTNEHLTGLAVTVSACTVSFRWDAGKEITVGTFASPDAAETARGEVADSPNLRVMVVGGKNMADEDDTRPVAQAAALVSAESDMRCIFSDGMVAGMASLRFEEGSAEHKQMVDAVKEGRPALEEAIKAEFRAEKWMERGRARTPQAAADKIAKVNAKAASMPWWNK